MNEMFLFWDLQLNLPSSYRVFKDNQTQYVSVSIKANTLTAE